MTPSALTDGQIKRFELELPGQAIAGAVSLSGRDAIILSSFGFHIVDLYQPTQRPWTLDCDAPGIPIEVQWHNNSQKSSYILSAIGDKLLTLDCNLGQTSSSPYEYYTAHTRAVTCVDTSSLNSDVIATSSLDAFTLVWDSRSPKHPALRLYNDGEPVFKVRLSPLDEHLLASTHGDIYCIWDLRNPLEPIRRVQAHPNRIRDLHWNPQVKDLILTCSSDCTVKFWNWSRVDYNGMEHESGTRALDRILQTDTPIKSAMHTTVGQGVLAGGDDVFLFDSRTRAFSDRKARVAPVHTWSLGGQRSTSIGVSRALDAPLSHISLIGQELGIIPVETSLLQKIGVDDHSMSEKSPIGDRTSFRIYGCLHTEEDRNRSYFEGKPVSDYGGFLQGRGADMSNEQTQRLPAEVKPNEAMQSVDLPPPPSVTVADQLTSIDDEDDEFAVISGDITALESNRDASRIIIVPPRRLAGAVFAPNGYIISFTATRAILASGSSPEAEPNFRGLASLFSHEAVSQCETDEELVTSVGIRSISFGKGMPAWYSRTPDWLAADGKEHDENALEQSQFDHRTTHDGPLKIQASTGQINAKISITDLGDTLPAKKYLAEKYTLRGSPRTICTHNQHVCEKYGLKIRAKAWATAALILDPVVPLQKSTRTFDEFVVARRNLVEIKRRDGQGNPIGIDYAFDEPVRVTKPIVQAPVDWLSHPFGNDLVAKLLDIFKETRDIQMLAMLTTVFAMASPRFDLHRNPDELQSGRVRLKFKNKERYSTARRKRSLLSPHDFEYHCAWRQCYADQLYAWGMPFARLEILQPNGAQKETSAMIRTIRSTFKPENDTEDSIPAICTICLETVQGICATCSECAHATHPDCLEMWIGDEQSDSQCPAGCTCSCGAVPEYGWPYFASNEKQ